MLPTRSCQTKQNPQTPIIVETYMLSKLTSQQHILLIDQALGNHHCFYINSFNYIVGDCLLDTIHVLLHGHYIVDELHNGLVRYFMESLYNGCAISLRWLQHELHPSILYDLYNVHDPTTYLCSMRILVARTNIASETRLWGDTFCIHWIGMVENPYIPLLINT